MRTRQEIKAEIKHYKSLLENPQLRFEEQTWMELQLKELRKELKSTKDKPISPLSPAYKFKGF